MKTIITDIEIKHSLKVLENEAREHLTKTVKKFDRHYFSMISYSLAIYDDGTTEIRASFKFTINPNTEKALGGMTTHSCYIKNISVTRPERIKPINLSIRTIA